MNFALSISISESLRLANVSTGVVILLLEKLKSAKVILLLKKHQIDITVYPNLMFRQEFKKSLKLTFLPIPKCLQIL